MSIIYVSRPNIFSTGSHLLLAYYCGQQTSGINKILTSCRRPAATICTRPSPPSVVAEALRAAEPTAAPADGNVAVGSHGEYFPRSPLQLPFV